MNKYTERLYNGLVKENPTFVLMLGMCPTLAVTTSAINGIGMGLSTTVVLVLSNMLISMLRKIIPDSVRMPAFIVVVASFVTIVQFLMEGFCAVAFMRRSVSISADRCKLYHFGKSGKLRVQESGAAVYV